MTTEIYVLFCFLNLVLENMEVIFGMDGVIMRLYLGFSKITTNNKDCGYGNVGSFVKQPTRDISEFKGRVGSFVARRIVLTLKSTQSMGVEDPRCVME